MKASIYILAISAALVLSSSSLVNTDNWKIGNGYFVKFSTKNASGEFKTLKGDIVFDENNLEKSYFNVALDVESIQTGIGLKNKHARSEKWFDAAAYPEIKFVSEKISRVNNGFEVTGKLDMHGVIRQIIIPFTFSNNLFSGSFTVNRLDYKVGVDHGFSATVGNEIKISLSVPVEK